MTIKDAIEIVYELAEQNAIDDNLEYLESASKQQEALKLFHDHFFPINST